VNFPLSSSPRKSLKGELGLRFIGEDFYLQQMNIINNQAAYAKSQRQLRMLQTRVHLHCRYCKRHGILISNDTSMPMAVPESTIVRSG
jgi:hypothetical protein